MTCVPCAKMQKNAQTCVHFLALWNMSHNINHFTMKKTCRLVFPVKNARKKLSDLCALLGIVEASVCDGGVATYGPGSANIIFVIFVKDNLLVILL